MKRLKDISFPAETLDPERATGLLLAGMGGPDGAESVEPFLRNLFRDPAVLPLPGPLARLVGSIIVRRRADEVRLRYLTLGLGGGSPQLSWAVKQCAALESLLAARGIRVRAVPAMRYWHPFPGESVSALLKGGAEQFLVLPAYPQYSRATSGSAFTAISEAMASLDGVTPSHFVREWHLLPGYIETLAARAEAVIRRWASEDSRPEECAVLPVAHSLPERFIKKGDPYLDQTMATVERLRSALVRGLSGLDGEWTGLSGVGSHLIAFQSKVGPVRWIGPEVEEETMRLAAAGCRRLLVLPVSFTCEHIETLHELDIELAAKARGAGIQEYVRAEALNTSPAWLESLADFLLETAFDSAGGTSASADASLRDIAGAGRVETKMKSPEADHV